MEITTEPITTTLDSLVLEATDVAEAEAFCTALGVTDRVRVRATDAPTSGFRGYSLSLVTAQADNVDALLSAAVDAGARVLKPATKSFWGYGAVVQAPDGSLWKLASTSKQHTGRASLAYDDLVLLLGVADVKAAKRFYVERGLRVAKSFGSKYVEFAAPDGGIKLALYERRAAAKDVGVDAEGSGSHRIAVVGTSAFTDPDGFVWESAAPAVHGSTTPPAR